MQAVLDRLRSQGIVDDARTACAVAEQTLGKKGWPVSRVRAMLAERGAAPEAIAAALDSEPDDAARARALAEQALAEGVPPARAARRLLSKGFDPDAVADAMAAAGFGAGESP